MATWWVLAACAAQSLARTPSFGNDWPLRQVCSNVGQVKWRELSASLWDQVRRSDVGQPLRRSEVLALAARSAEVNDRFGFGHQLEEVCWIGLLTLQFWELVMKFPLLHTADLQDDSLRHAKRARRAAMKDAAGGGEWALLSSADWSLVLLTDFPIFGLLRQVQASVNSCEASTQRPAERLVSGGPRRCPLPRCDLLDDDVEDQQHYLDALVNSALADEALYLMRSSSLPRCPLGQAANTLALALVEVSRWGGRSAWPKLAHLVSSAQQQELPNFPARQDDLGPTDRFSELLSSRWELVGLLHALQVRLHRSTDLHRSRPLPNLVRHALPAGRGQGERVFVDIGAFCHAHECLSRQLLSEVARDQHGRIQVFAFEPNRRNFLRTQAQLTRLPRRWQRHLHLRRAAAGNHSSEAWLHGSGPKASLKAGAYGGLLWRQLGEGRVQSSSDEHTERVPVKPLSALLQVSSIELLKIDVEGSELEVLEGAWPLIVQERVTSIILELRRVNGVDQQQGEDLSVVGYDGYFLGTKCFLPIKPWRDPCRTAASRRARYRRIPGSGSHPSASAGAWGRTAVGLKEAAKARGRPEGVSKPEGIQSSETRSCEPLPGGFKPVPLSRLAAVDQMEAKPPEKPEGEAMGPRPKAKTSQLHVEPVESKYVPPVTIDPKLLWSSCGKALPFERPVLRLRNRLSGTVQQRRLRSSTCGSGPAVSTAI
eukprot:g33322.t1